MSSTMGEPLGPREAAEERVRRRFEKERTQFLEIQHAQRKADLRDQKPVLDSLTQREAALKEERRLTLERIEREWQQERDRLGTKPLPAPSFGMTPPAPRDIRSEYDTAYKRYAERRDQARDGFDEQQNDMLRERMDTLHSFQTANHTRDRNFLDAQIQLVSRQEKTFERLVRREMERGDRTVSREFERHSRGREL